ncbi:MAG: hypothetical protein PF961_00765, partial [Planctomycetota bacterium]|nr:hypothetical protein [Planctomycetota bacterium]
MPLLRVTDLNGQQLTPEPGASLVLAQGEPLTLDGDWTAGRYLHCALRYDAMHHAKVQIRFFAANEADARITVTMGFTPGLSTNLVYDFQYLDGQTLFLPRMPGRLKATNFGRRIAPNEIDRVELALLPSELDQECHIGHPELKRDHPPPGLKSKVVVDALGQLSNRSWPSQTRDEEALVNYLNHEHNSSAASYPDDWSLYGGSKRNRFIGTGFFRTEFDGTRWWLVDPDGHGFFSAGLDCIRDSEGAAVVPGTEGCFAWLPGKDGEFADCRDANVSWGMALARFGRANLRRAFGDEWRRAWERMTLNRMRAWRFNTVGNWSDPSFARHSGLPYVMQLKDFPSTPLTLYRDLPDVFDPAYENAAAAFAQQLEPFRHDSCLIGYFLCNEPKWAFGGHDLITEILEDCPGSHTRHAFRNYVAMRYNGDAEAWKHAWGITDQLKDFDDLVTAKIHRLGDRFPAAAMDCRVFSREIVRRFVQVPAEACKAVDPHHLNLGIRFAWIANDLFYEIGDLVDVFSINCYQMKPDTEVADTVLKRCNKPMIIGEFHFGALDAGLTGTGLRGVATQEHRGLAYRNYMEACAAHPGIVGCHYFTLNDQPGLGRHDGECWQIGFVDVCHHPYQELVDQAAAAHEAMYRVRSGDEE